MLMALIYSIIFYLESLSNLIHKVGSNVIACGIVQSYTKTRAEITLMESRDTMVCQQAKQCEHMHAERKWDNILSDKYIQSKK